MAAADRGGDVADEMRALRARLAEAEQTLAAIRGGEVDALVVDTPDGDRVYTLTTADHPYRLIVEEMPDAAATVNPSGLVLYGNRRLAELVGAPLETVIGTSLADRIVPSSRPTFAHLLTVPAGGPVEADVQLTNAADQVITARMAAGTLHVDGERVVCLVISDLTERRRIDAELAELVYVASHDLSEPLRTIDGFAGLLEKRHRGQLDAEGVEFLDFITAGVGRMRRLLDDLLSYSRLNSQNEPFGPVDLQRVAAEVLADLHGVLEDTDTEVIVDDLPTVHGDAIQLAQVFQNLITNAVKFTSAGTAPRIRVSASRVGAAWRIDVTDNGIGVAPADRARAFGMFSRLQPRAAYAGTGMGLAICRKVVTRHGGDIWIDSRSGPGTTVSFLLPDRGDAATVSAAERGGG